MNVSIGCLGLGTIILFFVTMIFICESNKHIAELKKELDDAMACINCHQKAMQLMDDGIAKNEKDLNDIKKNFSSLDKGLDLTLTSHLNGIEGSLKGLLDVVEQEHADVVKWRSEAAERQIKAFCEYNKESEDTGDDNEPYADIPGDLDEGFEGEESATDEQREALEYISEKVNGKAKYEWIFPSRDLSAVPIVGEEYLVIGRNREDNDIVTDVGTWKGLYFNKGLPGGFDMNEGYKLNEVYAYVKLPSPSDVMNEVLDIRFKEG